MFCTNADAADVSPPNRLKADHAGNFRAREWLTQRELQPVRQRYLHALRPARAPATPAILCFAHGVSESRSTRPARCIGSTTVPPHATCCRRAPGRQRIQYAAMR